LYPDLYPFWDIFVELHASRTSNGFGPNPITYAEIESFMNIRDITEPAVRRRVTSLIKMMDTEFLRLKAEKDKK